MAGNLDRGACRMTNAGAGKPVFVCDKCGNETPKWEGRCPSCGEWNSLGEVRAARSRGKARSRVVGTAAQAEELSQVDAGRFPKAEISLREVNRVFGGGIVPGSLTMVAGDPGIGKSTLLLRVAADVAGTGREVVYVSGEESSAQIRMRADRLGVSGKRLFLLQATGVDEVVPRLDAIRPALVVVDSIQTMHDPAISSPAGSVAQIRETTRALTEWAKAADVPIVLTGHVTKSGDVAGPKVLEHMVDVVLYMEGDPIGSWRLLRAVKNRFGSTNEVGVLEMGEGGLRDVEDPSKEFLSERSAAGVGSVIVPNLEGARPLLVEIQALTNRSMLPAPRRVATGLDYNRLLMVCAVLTRRAGVPLADQDVIVNVAGGLRVTDPGADLGMALAIVSSVRDASIDPDLAAVGELGLSGEVRGVPQLERRVAEAARLGLQTCIAPAGKRAAPVSGGFRTRQVSTLRQALRSAFSIPPPPVKEGAN